MKIIFYVGLVVVVIADFFIPKYPYFTWAEWPVFYAIFGFVACVALVLTAKLLRIFVKRQEDYYD
jgi:hypothetical protein